MTGLLEWVKKLAAYLIVSQLLFQLLPHPRYRKYLRFFSGLVLVLLVASPLLGAGGLKQRLMESLDSLGAFPASGEAAGLLDQAEEARQEGLEAEYQALLRSQVESAAAAYGYQVVSLSAQVEWEETAEAFGEVQWLSVELSREPPAEIWIEPVQVGKESGGQAPEALIQDLAALIQMPAERVSLSFSGTGQE